MRALIIDDNDPFVSGLKVHLEAAGFEVVELAGPMDATVNYLTDATYDIARKLCQAFQEGDELLVFINTDIKVGNRQRQEQAGVEILKYLRLVQSFYFSNRLGLVENRGRDVACVMYSVRSLEQLLMQKPESLLLMSPGTTFLSPPDGLRKCDFASLVKRKAPMAALAPYFRVDLTLPDDRHAWANWWGVRQLWEVHKRVTDQPELILLKKGNAPEQMQVVDRRGLYPSIRIRDELRKINSQQAVFLFGANSRDLDQACANRSNQIDSLRRDLQSKTPIIFQIDDQWQDGWTETFVNMIYHPVPKSGSADSNPFKTYSQNGRPVFHVYKDFRIGESASHQAISKMYRNVSNIITGLKEDRPNVILLDLRLFSERGSKSDLNSLSGARILRKLRQEYPTLPIIITTASNKSRSLEGLMRLGADGYWIKEGLDERASANASVDNYIRLLRLVATAVGEKYQFLRALGEQTEGIKASARKKYWWQYWTWNRGDGTRELTEADAGRVYDILKETIALLRTYLHHDEMGYGFQDTGDQQFWLKTMVRHAGTVLEEVHRFDQLDGSYRTSGTIGGYRDQLTKRRVTRRGDWFAFRLYETRNEQAHLGETMNWPKLKSFLANLLCYLELGPKPNFRLFRGAIPTLAEMRQLDSDYRKLFNRLQRAL